MSRFLKTSLLCLLIAILPIQGMAAIVKAACGSGRHDMAITAMKHAHAEAGEDAMMAHHHGGQAFDEHHHAVASSADTGHSPSRHVHKSAYCGACALCCLGAQAPPMDMSWNPVLDVLPAQAPSLFIRFSGHVPARLERPPRHLSA